MRLKFASKYLFAIATYFIRHCIWLFYSHHWNSIFWKPLWYQTPSQVWYIWLKIKIKTRRINRIWGKTTHGIKHVLLEHIKNEVLTLTSERISSEDNFERKLQAKLYPPDKIFYNKKNNWYISREKKKLNKNISHQNTFKIKCLLSLMKLHLLMIALKPNYRPSLITLIKFSNNQKKNLWISWNNSTKNRNRLKDSWFLSIQKHFSSHKLLKC